MEFLNSKRTAFPRFYFVSEDILLDILSNGNNPAKINAQGHISKIFQTIDHFKMDEHENDRPEIKGIVTCVGQEEFEFDQKLKVIGKVECYMQDFIEHITAMTKLIIERSHKKRVEMCVEGGKGINQWYKEEIAGPTIVVNQIFWTKLVEQAFDNIAAGK